MHTQKRTQNSQQNRSHTHTHTQTIIMIKCTTKFLKETQSRDSKCTKSIGKARWIVCEGSKTERKQPKDVKSRCCEQPRAPSKQSTQEQPMQRNKSH